MAYIRDALSAAAPQLAQKILDGAVEKLADSCFDIDPAWNFKPAPSIVTNRPVVSDDLVAYLRTGSIISVAGVKRFVDDCHVELDDGDDGSILQVDAVVFATGYTADLSLMPDHNPLLLEQPSLPPPPSPQNQDQHQDQDQQHQHPPQLARLYKNIFLPSHPLSIAYLCNWTLGDGIMPIADLASMAITQVWKRTFPLPSQEQMNRDIDAQHAWALARSNSNLDRSTTTTTKGPGGGTAFLREIVHQGPWIAWLHCAAGTGVNAKLGYGVSGWAFWAWEPALCGLLMRGVDSPHVMRLFETATPGKGRKRWRGARGAILRVNEDAERRIEERKKIEEKEEEEERERERGKDKDKVS